MAERPCSCGDRSRPYINHRVRVPCWTYIGSDRVDVEPVGSNPEHRFEQSQYFDAATDERVHVVICTNPEHDPCPAEREMFREKRAPERRHYGGRGETQVRGEPSWPPLPGGEG